MVIFCTVGEFKLELKLQNNMFTEIFGCEWYEMKMAKIK
jgi:hypothetical protein